MNQGVYTAENSEQQELIRSLCALVLAYEHKRPLPEDVSLSIIYEGRNRLYAVRYRGTEYVVKTFAQQPWLIRMAELLGITKGKAKRSHLYARELERRGIGVAHSLGYALLGSGLVYKRAFHISLKLETDVPHIQAHARGWASPDGFIEALAAFLVRLHKAGVQHLDLSPGNVLYRQDEGGAYHFFLVDLNRMCLHSRALDLSSSIQNMARLMNTNSTTRRLAYYYALERELPQSDAVITSLTRQTDLFWDKRYLKLCRRYAQAKYGMGLWAFIRMYIRYRWMLHQGNLEEAAILYRQYLQREDIRHLERRSRGFSYRYL